VQCVWGHSAQLTPNYFGLLLKKLDDDYDDDDNDADDINHNNHLQPKFILILNRKGALRVCVKCWLRHLNVETFLDRIECKHA